MSFHKICANPHCLAPFETAAKATTHCSISCGNRMRTLVSPEDIKTYFLARAVIPDDPMACWGWTGSTNDAGYAMAFVRDEKLRAHRLAYEIFVGPIPKGMDILHGPLCAERSCTNWRHLRPGTNTENVQDRVDFGHQVRGSKHYMAELTERRVEEILILFNDYHWTQQAILERYPMHPTTMHDVIYRKTWKHVMRGKYPVPAKDGRAKLPKLEMIEIVKDMRRLRQHEHWSYEALNKKYDQFTYGTIIDICTYRSWKAVA